MSAQSPLKGSSGASAWVAPLIVLPMVVGLVFAAHSWVKSREARKTAAITAEKNPAQTEISEKSKREVATEVKAKVAESGDSYESSARSVSDSQSGTGIWGWFTSLFSSSKGSSSKVASRINPSGSIEELSEGEEESPRGKRGGTNAITLIPVAESDDCPAYEIRGLGPERERVSKADWQSFMALYHEVKADILKWVSLQNGKWTSQQIETVSSLIREQKIQRPPTYEEPDLSWRGVAVVTQDEAEKPLLRVGGGMIRLMQSDRRRARFELTRLLSQVALPCHIKSAGVESPWGELSSCFGVKDEPRCEVGSYSDLGWAISTAVAVELSAPGCKIPALNEPKLKQCVSAALAMPVPGSRSVASDSEKGASL